METEKIGKTGEQMGSVGFLHGYPLMIMLGIVCATLSVAYFGKRYKYSWDILQMLIIIVIPMSIIGAKFYTLLVDGGGDTWYQLSGLSIYGALIFSIGSGMTYIYFVRHAVDFRTVISIIIPSILLGQAIGRGGNFFNHEVYGKIVDGSSLDGMTFLKSDMLINNFKEGTVGYRAPLFLYESLLSLLGYFVLVGVLNRKSVFKPGTTSGLYMVWYGIVRLILQTFRNPTQTSFIGDSDVPLNLVVSILVIALGIFLAAGFEFGTRPFGKIRPPKKYAKYFKKEYEAIFPIKPRRIMFFGEKVEYKRKIMMYWGKQVENRVKLGIPVRKDEVKKRTPISKKKNNKV